MFLLNILLPFVLLFAFTDLSSGFINRIQAYHFTTVQPINPTNNKYLFHKDKIINIHRMHPLSAKKSKRRVITNDGDNYQKSKSKIVHYDTAIRLSQQSDDVKLEIIKEVKEEDLTFSYVILGMLLVAFASNQWSRQAIYYLCDFTSTADPFKHINQDIGFTKEMYATLASFGFTAVFATVSLFAGSVSDRFNRVNIIILSCISWSIITALHSQAHAYSDLIPLRALLGISQAFFNPAAYTLIADIFPKRLVGSMNGVFSSGIFLGGGLASLSILLDNQIGWRVTMLTIGLIGLFIAFLCAIIIQDPRDVNINNNILDTSTTTISTSSSINNNNIVTTSTSNSGSSFSISEVYLSLKEVLESLEARLLLSASVIRFCAGFSIAIWKAPFVFAKFPGSESAFAGSNALIVSVGGLLSSLLGGYLSDRLATPENKLDKISNNNNNNNNQTNSTTTATLLVKARARSWIPAIGSFLAAPAWIGFLLSTTPEQAAICLFCEYLAAECWIGPTLASLFQVVPQSRRGTAQGLFSVLTAVGNLGPLLVGMIAGKVINLPTTLVPLLSSSSSTLIDNNVVVVPMLFSLSDALLIVVSGSYIISGLLFTRTAIEEDRKIQLSYNQLINKKEIE